MQNEMGLFDTDDLKMGVGFLFLRIGEIGNPSIIWDDI